MSDQVSSVQLRDPWRVPNTVERMRKGFSLVEVIGVLVVLAILAALTSGLLGNTRTKVGGEAATIRLATTQLAVRSALSMGSFPADLKTVPLNSVSWTEGESTSSDIVSVRRVDDSTAVYALTDGVNCTYLVDTIGSVERWARSSTATCSALSLDPAQANGTRENPSSL